MRLLPLIAISSSLLILASCSPISTTISTLSRGARVASQDRSIGMAVDDLTIETTINHRFFRTDVNDLFKNVDTDVIEGRVFLTGNVNNHISMVRAVDHAWEVKGVREVINEIQVENKSDITDAAQDIWIELQAEGELLITEGVQSTNYNVECVNSVVTLMGIAQSEQELSLVTNLVSRTAGVTKVVSHVIMKDDPRRIIPKSEKPVTHYE
ncbi:MAG: BON domain-containing protein [Rickettsiales bacterium]|nr:BON domain-containing protein [Rickettsiales bacterium]